MPSAQIRINKTKELTDVLQALRSIYRLLNEADIVKLALSRFYELEMERKHEVWISSLPTMHLSEEEQSSLSEGIKELEGITSEPKTADSIMEEIHQDTNV